jgi:hypothetical protein
VDQICVEITALSGSIRDGNQQHGTLEEAAALIKLPPVELFSAAPTEP